MGRTTDTAMVRKEPMRDMKYARKGTYRAAAKQAHASSVRTTNLLAPAGIPAMHRMPQMQHSRHAQPEQGYMKGGS